MSSDNNNEDQKNPTFVESLPMYVIIALVVFSYLSFFSVILG